MTPAENRLHWSGYDWRRGGEEWSAEWGSSALQWRHTIRPRIARHLASKPTAIEIGCGFGRWSRYLAGECAALHLCDLYPEAVQAARNVALGSGSDFVIDGTSLPAVGPVEFVFSFDSLVHADLPTLTPLLASIASALHPKLGAAWLHHSNFKWVRGQTPELGNWHARAADVCADSFFLAAQQAGLSVVSQEIITWGPIEFCDCLSVVTWPGSQWDRPKPRVWNGGFMEEARAIRRIGELYEVGPCG